MISKKLMTKKILIGPVAGAILSAGILIGCAVDIDTTLRDGQDSDRATLVVSDTPVVSVSTHAEGSEGSEGDNEHGSGGESGREGGGSEGGIGAMLAPEETFDMTRAGARLILNYDATSNAFTGTVENTTNNTLTNVRIEVHLSNGTELGPTTPVDMAPGEVAAVNLAATRESFAGWVDHAEVGGGESGGEHGSGGERKGGGQGKSESTT